MTNQALDLARRIKAYQAHIAGKPNQDRFIELCDELFAVLRQDAKSLSRDEAFWEAIREVESTGALPDGETNTI